MKVYLTLLVVAALVAYAATPAMRHLAHKAGAVTAVRDRDVHTLPTARLGGIAIFLGLAAGILIASNVPFLDPVFETSGAVWGVLGGAARITSYYSNSPLAMTDGPAEGEVRTLLEPFAADLPPEALEGYALPVSDGSERNRRNIARATELMAEAGFEIGDGGLMRGPDGTPFTFEILLKQGATEYQQVIDIYVEALKRLGIEPTVTVVDPAQYTQRVESYDFDMTDWRVGVSLSPGNEQRLYWGASGVTENGTKNYPGIDSPAAEAMIDALVNADSQEGFRAAVQALDRVLTTGRYAIPIWEYTVSRVAYYDHLHHPETIPLYGDWIGWQPDVWWSDPDGQ